LQAFGADFYISASLRLDGSDLEFGLAQFRQESSWSLIVVPQWVDCHIGGIV
jgi:hypothetical protein